MTTLEKMIEKARGGNADALFSCPEFTRAEIVEYLPEVRKALLTGSPTHGLAVDVLREGTMQ